MASCPASAAISHFFGLYSPATILLLLLGSLNHGRAAYSNTLAFNALAAIEVILPKSVGDVSK